MHCASQTPRDAPNGTPWLALRAPGALVLVRWTKEDYHAAQGEFVRLLTVSMSAGDNVSTVHGLYLSRMGGVSLVMK